MAERFVAHLATISEIAVTQTGPFIYGVYADWVRPLWPK